MLAQESDASKQHTWCAVATLGRAQFGKGFLQRMQLAVLFQPLNGYDLALLYFQGSSVGGWNTKSTLNGYDLALLYFQG